MNYTVMKALIENEKFKLKNQTITLESYSAWKTQTLKKLDLYKRCNRLTMEQYNELVKNLDETL